MMLHFGAMHALLGALSIMLVPQVDASMLITGVIDGPLSGGIPKAIELYVTADIADLSIYGVGSANNGGGTDGAEFTFPSDSVSEGDFIYVASETPGFNNFFGFNPVYTSSAASINGDDAIELFENGSVIDTFGDVNTDGTGELWEYLDGWAYRNSGTTAGAFDVSDWSFSGPNALDGESTNAAATSPFPIGTYAPTNTITTTTTSTTPPPPVVTIMEIQADQQVPLPLSLASDPVPLVSPFLGQSVETSGVVIHVTSNTIYMQDPDGDGDDTTSDAMSIFVGSGNVDPIAVGDHITVTGTVSEFYPGGESTGNQPTTQFAFPDIVVNSSGNSLPSPVVIGRGGRVPPTMSMVDGLNFFESLEAMLVKVQDPIAIAGTNRFGETFVAVDQGMDATGISERGTLNISPLDFNPEKVQIQGGGLDVVTGAVLSDVTGVIGYSFGNYEVLPTEPITVLEESKLKPVVTHLHFDHDCVSLATYNVLNLDANDSDGDTDLADGRFDAIAAHIATNMMSPDIVALQEVQDSSGSSNDGTVEASITLQTLVDAIVAEGGPTYEFQDNPYITDGQSGGQPGGNIRTAYLYNPSRISLLGTEQLSCQDTGCAFAGARLPLVAKWASEGNRILTTVNVHFSSKGGSAPIVGVQQPFERRQEEATVNGSLDERLLQAAAVRGYVQNILNDDDTASVAVMGDFNEFEFISPLVLFGLNNLVAEEYGENEIYTFIFQGNSQALDHILVSDVLADKKKVDVELVHVNSEFPDSDSKASDHDPILAQLCLPPAQVCEGKQVMCSKEKSSKGKGGKGKSSREGHRRTEEKNGLPIRRPRELRGPRDLRGKGKGRGKGKNSSKVTVCVSYGDYQETMCVDKEDDLDGYKYTCGCCPGEEELCM